MLSYLTITQRRALQVGAFQFSSFWNLALKAKVMGSSCRRRKHICYNCFFFYLFEEVTYEEVARRLAIIAEMMYTFYILKLHIEMNYSTLLCVLEEIRIRRQSNNDSRLRKRSHKKEEANKGPQTSECTFLPAWAIVIEEICIEQKRASTCHYAVQCTQFHVVPAKKCCSWPARGPLDVPTCSLKCLKCPKVRTFTCNG